MDLGTDETARLIRESLKQKPDYEITGEITDEDEIRRIREEFRNK